MCGRVSRPPEATDATLCRASGLRFGSLAANSIYFGPNASRAIPIPPEAEPVAPASTDTAIASEIRGVPGIPRSIVVNVAKPGTDLTTPPKPLAAAVLPIDIRPPAAPSLIAFGNSLAHLRFNTMARTTASNREPTNGKLSAFSVIGTETNGIRETIGFGRFVSSAIASMLDGSTKCKPSFLSLPSLCFIHRTPRINITNAAITPIIGAAIGVVP